MSFIQTLSEFTEAIRDHLSSHIVSPSEHPRLSTDTSHLIVGNGSDSKEYYIRSLQWPFLKDNTIVSDIEQKRYKIRVYDRSSTLKIITKQSCY